MFLFVELPAFSIYLIKEHQNKNGSQSLFWFICCYCCCHCVELKRMSESSSIDFDTAYKMFDGEQIQQPELSVCVSMLSVCNVIAKRMQNHDMNT